MKTEEKLLLLNIIKFQTDEDYENLCLKINRPDLIDTHTPKAIKYEDVRATMLGSDKIYEGAGDESN